MPRSQALVIGLSTVLAASFEARAQSHGHSSGHGHHSESSWWSGSGSHHGSNLNPITINPNPGGSANCPPWRPPVVIGGGWIYPLPYGYYPYPPVIIGPILGTPTPLIPSFAFPTFGSLTATVEPPILLPTSVPKPSVAPARRPAAAPRRHDGEKAKEMTLLGDRLFRAGLLPRAVERYEQAIRADPDRAEPRSRLAQIALVRGQYAEAAQRLREANDAEPGWLATAGDVQKLYPEPGDFARRIAVLEKHLQAHPEDRDAWLVLGAMLYLSGRTDKAADVFLRLSDRQLDPTLRAFLRATKAGGIDP